MTELRPAATTQGRPPLLEREREPEALEEVLHRARLGDGGLVVVEGAAGIGKSRLMEELRERGARAGLRVLSA